MPKSGIIKSSATKFRGFVPKSPLAILDILNGLNVTVNVQISLKTTFNTYTLHNWSLNSRR